MASAPAAPPFLVGVDLGGTKCAVCVPEGEHGVREVARFATSGPEATLARIYREIEALHPPRHAVFGVSCGGPLDATAGLILSPPNLPGWDRIPVTAELTRRFGGRAFLMNDANACALAEWQDGAGQGARNVVFLTMGTGMGAGLILDGRLYEGTNGNAGEVGHVRLAPSGPVGYGKAGSFEGFCSGGGIAQIARQRVAAHAGDSLLKVHPAGSLAASHVGAAAEQGDALALSIWHEVGTRLGEALSVIIDVLNPERIVIGSIFARCHRFITPAMNEVLAREALAPAHAVCTVVPATLGDQIGSHAAVAIARYHLSLDPNPA